MYDILTPSFKLIHDIEKIRVKKKDNMYYILTPSFKLIHDIEKIRV